MAGYVIKGGDSGFRAAHGGLNGEEVSWVGES